MKPSGMSNKPLLALAFFSAAMWGSGARSNAAEAPLKLMSLTGADYGAQSVAKLRPVDLKEACDYIGEVKWERASLPGAWTWALAADEGRGGVFRVSVEVESKVCQGVVTKPVRFTARFGEVMVHPKHGKFLPAGFLTQVEAQAFHEANARK
jgi:hypothetical protein